MTQPIAMTDEIRTLRARMKDFIDNEVFPAEAELEREAEHDLHAETGLPLELYAAAKARGDDPTQGVRGPGPTSPRAARAAWPRRWWWTCIPTGPISVD